MTLVVLDPGHGGHDPGAVGPHGLRESDVNLAVSLATRDSLEAAGYEVVLTRQSDEFIPIGVRARMANQVNADCFVSIHCNAFTNPQAHGTETFAFSPASLGTGLARIIQPRLIDALGTRDRGVKFANFQVLRETRMPAVLPELAFISNPAEEAMLADHATQGVIAVTLSTAIQTWRTP